MYGFGLILICKVIPEAFFNVMHIFGSIEP